MMKHKRLTAIVMSLVLVLFIMVVGIIIGLILLQKGDEKEEYTNFFEYAVAINYNEWTYSPAQLEFGMNKEEVLDMEGLDESAVLPTDSEVIFTKETICDVSDTIKEIEFSKSFIVLENDGLVKVGYQFLVPTTNLEEMCMLLYEQAVSYMPEEEQISLEKIKEGKDVSWRGHESDGLKSYVDFSTDEYYESDPSKRIISFSIYLK